MLVSKVQRGVCVYNMGRGDGGFVSTNHMGADQVDSCNDSFFFLVCVCVCSSIAVPSSIFADKMIDAFIS